MKKKKELRNKHPHIKIKACATDLPVACYLAALRPGFFVTEHSRSDGEHRGRNHVSKYCRTIAAFFAYQSYLRPLTASVIDADCIVHGTGTMQRSSVRPSVRLSVPSIDSSNGDRRVCC